MLTEQARGYLPAQHPALGLFHGEPFLGCAVEPERVVASDPVRLLSGCAYLSEDC